MTQPPIHTVILAAGQGARMRSQLPKVCHLLAGEPMLAHVVRTAQAVSSQVTVVVGHGAAQVQAALGELGAAVQWVHQAEQLGTGHAVRQALPHISAEQRVLILYGDVPLVRPETLAAWLAAAPHSVSLLTAEVADPTGYGRIERAADGAVQAIVEHKDATAAQRQICEINTGLMAVPGAALQRWLPQLNATNAQQEFYLTDLVQFAVAEQVPVHAFAAPSVAEILGVNTRVELAARERTLQQRRAEDLMLAGATVADPSRLTLRGAVAVGLDCELDVGVVLHNVVLGAKVRIGAYCVLRDVTVGEGSVIEPHCVLEQAELGSHCQVGPFARLRPHTQLANGAKVGNFVELKNAHLGAGAKVNHLSYVGDAQVGAEANIGAGTITCNYDGANKHRTHIGEGAFVGSNSTLVAPLVIEAGAFIGAGSVITKTAPQDQLTLSRSRQTTLAGWQRPKKDAS